MSKRIPSKIAPRNTELIDLFNFDPKRIHFDAPTEMETQQGNKAIKYYNINLGSTNKGGVGELIIDLPFFVHSFGVEEFQSDSGKPSTHSVSLSIVDISNPTEEQNKFVESFCKVIDKIKDHVLAVKKEIKKPTLDRSELKKFNPMYQSLDEDGNPKGTAWYFSPKLMERKIYNKDDPTDIKSKMETKFYLDEMFDEKGNPMEISPLEFLKPKHFKFRGAIKIEKIYVGSKISLQCKIYDGVVRQVSNERKTMTILKRGPATGSAAPKSAASALLDEPEDDDTEIVLEDD